MSEMIKEKEGKYEKIILSYFLNDKIFIDSALTKKIKPEWFVNAELRSFYKIIVSYYLNTSNILTKSIYLNDVKEDQSIEPALYCDYDDFFQNIVDSLPDQESFDYYFSKFRDESLSKFAIDSMFEFVENNKKNEMSFNDNIKNTTKKLLSLQHDIEAKEWQSIDFVNDIEIQLTDINQRRTDPEKYSGIKTYYPSIDYWYNGFEKGSLNVIAGRPGTGKSTLMKCISWQQCLNGKNVLILSCEDDILIWSNKITSSETGIPLSSILRGEITEDQENSITRYKNDLKNSLKSKYSVIQLGGRKFTVPNIEMIIENNFSEWIPDIIFVDQISLIKPTERYGSRIDMEFGEVTKGLRSLAKKWNIPMVAASQVDRSSVKEKKGIRVTEIFGENLSQSDQVYQDSDSVFAIQLNSQDKSQCTLKIVKQRNGATDIAVPLRFEREICAFKDPEFVIEGMESESLVSNGKIFSEANELTDKYNLDELLHSEGITAPASDYRKVEDFF